MKNSPEINMRNNFLLRSILFVSLFPLAIIAQNQKPPCSDAQASQFDFWIGSWDLQWNDAKGNLLSGTNTIKKTMNGCVIEENFNGGGTPTYLGKSYSMFDGISGKWKQSWVDNGGAYLDFTGEFKGDRMILRRDFLGKDGKKVMQRMTFYNIQPDNFDWLWERSDDQGKTWKANWKIKYSRSKNSMKKFDIKEIKAIVDAANKTYDQRFHRNDNVFWNERYTADACTMPPNEKRICGRENIRDYFYGNGGGVKLVINAEDVSGGESLVVETGNYTVNDLSGKSLEKGKFIATWKNEDGKWKMFSEIWSSDESIPTGK